MIWKPHVTVAAIVEREGKFLLVEEVADGATVLNQPAGHLDEGESLKDAVIRETLEETAWHFRPDALVGIYRWQHPAKSMTFIRTTFCGDVGHHDSTRTLDEGIIRTVWMTRDELDHNPDRLRSPLVLRGIDDYLAGKRYPLALLNDVD